MNVTFEERPSLHGYRIAIASLDAPASLNALSLPMIDALQDRLHAWAEAADIACVIPVSYTHLTLPTKRIV